MLRSLSIFVFFLLGPAVSAQDISPLRIHEVLQADPELQIVLETINAEGLPVRSLNASELEIDVDGFRSRIESVEGFVDSGVGFGTVILIDTSNSMANSMEEVKQAARDYVAGMRGGDVAIIAQFKENVEGHERDWSNEKPILRDQIDRLAATGKETHLNEALNRVLDSIATRQTGPELQSILVLTDGLDYRSPTHLSLDRARGLAEKHGVPISTVHYIPNKHNASAKTQEGREVLENLAKDSQGLFAHAETASDITRRFQEIQSQIHSLWVVNVATESMPAGSNPQLKVAWGGQARTAILNLDAAWKGAEFEPEEVIEEPSETPVALIIGGISALILLGGGLLISKKNKAQREEDRMASEQAARSAQQAADRAMDEAKKAQAQLVEAKEEAEAEKARAAEEAESAARAAAEKAQAAEAAPSSETPAPRKTMFRSPGGAGVAQLLLENGSTVQIFSGLGAASVRIGGDPERVDVVLEHETVSGHHANLTRSDTGAIYLEDVGSSNGTYVNNQDIRGQGPMLIQPGQAIQFGLLKTSLGA